MSPFKFKPEVLHADLAERQEPHVLFSMYSCLYLIRFILIGCRDIIDFVFEICLHGTSY